MLTSAVSASVYSVASLAFVLGGFVYAADPQVPNPLSFSQAKKHLQTVYKDHPTSFYCGCSIDQSAKKWRPELADCGYQARKNLNRAQRIEWEHVMPAWAFGHQLQCWQQGGRKACRKDPKFKQMEGDMHNLVPAIGEVNGDRSNYRFTMLAGEERKYGVCDFEIDFKAKAVEPPMAVRGDIARSYFYMRDTYGVRLSKKETQLFTAWDKQDPVDAWELTKSQRVSQKQGNPNPYVERGLPRPNEKSGSPAPAR